MSTSSGAKYSRSRAASPSMKKTLFRPFAWQRSMAITIASGTRSRAIYNASGCCWAVSAVKRPFPQPSSSRNVCASGFKSLQRPRYSWGERMSIWEHRSIRGSKLGFFLIRIGLTSSSSSHFYHSIEKEYLQSSLKYTILRKLSFKGWLFYVVSTLGHLSDSSVYFRRAEALSMRGNATSQPVGTLPEAGTFPAKPLVKKWP